MKQFLFLAVLFSGCTPMINSMSGHSYKYSISMTKPKQDTSLVYRDDKTEFTFSFSKSEIDFTLKNISDVPLKVIWDEASIVQFGKVEKIMHKGIKYIDRNSAMPAATIPPGATLDDLAVPTANVSYSSYTGDWITTDFFPHTDYYNEKTKKAILNKKGEEFSLYLPVRDTKGNEIGYSFQFKIDDVVCANCKVEEPKKKK